MTLQEKIYHTDKIADAIQKSKETYNFYDYRWYHVALPLPQKAGTMTQQRTYAISKAMDLIVQAVKD